MHHPDKVSQAGAHPLHFRGMTPMFLSREVDNPTWSQEGRIACRQHMPHPHIARLGGIFVFSSIVGEGLAKHERDTFAHHTHLVDGIDECVSTRLQQISASVSNHYKYQLGFDAIVILSLKL